MTTLKPFPEWETIAKHLRHSLGYSESTITRCRYTYNVFVNDYCTFKGGDTSSILQEGTKRVNDSYENGVISKDKLLRIRRLAFRMLQFVQTGTISWERAPLYGKKYGNSHNESLLASYISCEQTEHRHAESIIKRDENLIRQYILFVEGSGRNIEDMDTQGVLDFLIYMKKLRPAGLKSTVSAVKHFYLFLIDIGLVETNILLALKSWDTPHKKAYGILSASEKERLLGVIDNSYDIGKRDKAIMMLAMDCGLRSSDICSLKLSEIDWRTSSVCIIQQKTQNQLSVPFSRKTGDAIADYILNARGKSDLPYVFLKKSYFDSAMTSSLLCTRIKKYLKKAGINRPKSEKISMHTFRRSLGTALIDSGENLEMVAQVLGHKDKEATKGYISVSERMLRSCPMEMPELTVKRGGAL